jgi:hypothetical protein
MAQVTSENTPFLGYFEGFFVLAFQNTDLAQLNENETN